MGTKKLQKPSSAVLPEVVEASHRSGAVARMLRMPVATLRVWERRYGLTQPALSPAGQRRYSADDVRRLAWLKQLTDLGHAIGSLAGLDMVQLQRVASTHAQALATTKKDTRMESATQPPVRSWRVAVIGAALGRRLQRPALLRRLHGAVVLSGPFDNAAQAGAALRASDVDAVLVQEPQLQPNWLEAIDAAAPSLAGVPKAVLYSFATDAVCEALASSGTALLREPQPDAVLAQWLSTLSTTTTTVVQQAGAGKTLPVTESTPPRRWDDAALVDFAGRSSTIACECPRHLAELLLQLAHFEAYSAECEHRTVGDAEIHAYLREEASAARARFEAALEHVALHEGLLLPASPRHEVPAATPRSRRAKSFASTDPRRGP